MTKRLLIISALIVASGCSSQHYSNNSSSLPQYSAAALPQPPAMTRAFLATLGHADLPAVPAGLNIRMPEYLLKLDALSPNSSAGPNDNQVVGVYINPGPYNAMIAQNTAYLPANLPLNYPLGATGQQQLLAPVTLSPGRSCVASGTTAINSGSGVSTYFVVFDICHAGFHKQLAAIPIDSTFISKYVTNSPASNNLPVYSTLVGTTDVVPNTNTIWQVLIYNNLTKAWEIVASEKGLSGANYGLSAYISYYQPGACPSGLPPIAANNLQIFNTNSQHYELVTPTMSSTTSRIQKYPGSAQCFFPDATGPSSSTFTVRTPNNSWIVNSGAPNAGYKYDDWTEFAHDNLHTGFQPQPTGISTTSVSNLALRWKVSVPNHQAIYASPLVYNGNVLVVTDAPPVVYDLSAVDGHVIWSYALNSQEVRGTPTIDPAAGLVFIPDRRITNNGVLPSFLTALHLKDGTVAWVQQLNGITHQGPIVANGVVYQGTSGGDSPDCLNGGVTALNELNGVTNWVWHVNSQINPGGGGSVWGAIAYDGSHLVFGTGNTCGTNKYPTANGEVALDLNGHVLWDFQAEPRSFLDYDTGGGTVISHGLAMFKNKTGILYFIDVATGQLIRKTTIDPNFGYGEFPSPSTDGQTTVISYGLDPNGPAVVSRPAFGTPQGNLQEEQIHRNLEALERRLRTLRNRPFDNLPGYHSSLVGINSVGTVIWTHPMNAMIDGHAAIVNGVTFADDDSALSAFDLQNGTRLWTYAFPSLPSASPAIVPSGVYATDGSGNVYAFALPSQ